jgi:hypothetical protein
MLFAGALRMADYPVSESPDPSVSASIRIPAIEVVEMGSEGKEVFRASTFLELAAPRSPIAPPSVIGKCH